MNTKTIKSNKRTYYKNLRNKSEKHVERDIYNQVSRVLTQKKFYGISRQGYLGLYWPLEGEIDLTPLKLSIKDKLALPASNKDGTISYRPWTKSPLTADAMNIPAPLFEKELQPHEMSLLLVPALSTDRAGTRLGYGGGFFDRLRSDASWRKLPAIAVLPQVCVSEKILPKDNWDIPLNGWISEMGLSICLQRGT